jgi:hypothetical protein
MADTIAHYYKWGDAAGDQIALSFNKKAAMCVIAY